MYCIPKSWDSSSACTLILPKWMFGRGRRSNSSGEPWELVGAPFPYECVSVAPPALLKTQTKKPGAFDRRGMHTSSTF